jgi:adenylate cyclase
MGVEIERKFLVKGAFKPFAKRSERICQGYLSSVPERTVRVRIVGERGYLTVKGAASTSGMSRFEWEREISCDEATTLLELCEPGAIDKTRYWVSSDDQIFEVDEFHGDNEGLTLAEIELATESATFQKPDWLGDEVTGDVRYYNAYLTNHPFRSWRDDD